MANRGDRYTVQLKAPYLAWGEYRNPTNRLPISGEGYIPIPRAYAERFDIFNSNHNPSGLGYNLFYASSADGYLNNVVLLAQGSMTAGDVYAKQFSVQGDLQVIGSWYEYCRATPENSVSVEWIDPTHIMLEII